MKPDQRLTWAGAMGCYRTLRRYHVRAIVAWRFALERVHPDALERHRRERARRRS